MDRRTTCHAYRQYITNLIYIAYILFLHVSLMVDLLQLHTMKEFQELLMTHDCFLLYKYNPNNCRLSEKTRPIVERICTEKNIPGYRIDVISSPELKMDIATYTTIEHQSPQLIIFSQGSVVAQKSHMGITYEWIQQYI